MAHRSAGAVGHYSVRLRGGSGRLLFGEDHATNLGKSFLFSMAAVFSLGKSSVSRIIDGLEMADGAVAAINGYPSTLQVTNAKGKVLGSILAGKHAARLFCS